MNKAVGEATASRETRSRGVLLISLQQDLTVIGLRYLHACLLNAGYHSHYLHIPRFDRRNLKALEGLRHFVADIDPLYVGISLMSTEFADARDLSAYLKQHFSNLPIVWGGVHPTIDPESCVSFADYACIGEGEQTVVDLADALASGGDAREVNNLCCRQDGAVRRNRLYPVIEDLDSIPTYEHIPSHGYLQEPSGAIRRLDWRLAMKYGRYQHKFYDVLTSRGCPFSCTYCCSDLVARVSGSMRVRRRSLEHVIDELENAVRDFPFVEMVNIHDENFLSHDIGFIKAFAEAYRRRVNVPFMFAAIPLYITEDKMRLLKEAGLSWVRMGLQSGSDRVLKDVYRRKSLGHHFLRAADVLNRLGIAAYCDVILDNPFETADDQRETIRRLLETPRPFYLQLYSLSAYFGSELHERILKECPERLEDPKQKDYLVYRRSQLNELTRLSAYAPRAWVRAMIAWHRQNADSRRLAISLMLAKVLSLTVFEPVAQFRVFKRSQGRWSLKLLKGVPAYARIWLDRFSRQLAHQWAIRRARAEDPPS